MGNSLQTQTQTQTNPPPQLQLQTQIQHQQVVNETETPTLTCEICIEPITHPTNQFSSKTCSHPYCTTCISKYIQLKLTDENSPTIKCPSPTCPHSLDLFSCAPFISRALFVRWTDVLCESVLIHYNKCFCPRRQCGWLILNECGGRVRKSVCPKCKGVFCFQCGVVWHSGFGCEESGEMRDGSEVAFGRLVEEKKWKRCPKCRHFVELREGCQIVKCRCGISFCYKCGKQVHQHWCSCDTTSACMGWCGRICLVLILLTFAFFFITFLVGKYQPKN